MDYTISQVEGKKSLQIAMLDVDFGDSILVQTNSQTILFDCGQLAVNEKGDSHDIRDRSQLLFQALEDFKVTNIDKMIITHPHPDHDGNLLRMLLQDLYMAGENGKYLYNEPKNAYAKKVNIKNIYTTGYGNSRFPQYRKHVFLNNIIISYFYSLIQDEKNNDNIKSITNNLINNTLYAQILKYLYEIAQVYYRRRFDSVRMTVQEIKDEVLRVLNEIEAVIYTLTSDDSITPLDFRQNLDNYTQGIAISNSDTNPLQHKYIRDKISSSTAKDEGAYTNNTGTADYAVCHSVSMVLDYVNINSKKDTMTLKKLRRIALNAVDNERRNIDVNIRNATTVYQLTLTYTTNQMINYINRNYSTNGVNSILDSITNPTVKSTVINILDDFHIRVQTINKSVENVDSLFKKTISDNAIVYQTPIDSYLQAVCNSINTSVQSQSSISRIKTAITNQRDNILSNPSSVTTVTQTEDLKFFLNAFAFYLIDNITANNYNVNDAKNFVNEITRIVTDTTLRFSVVSISKVILDIQNIVNSSNQVKIIKNNIKDKIIGWYTVNSNSNIMDFGDGATFEILWPTPSGLSRLMEVYECYDTTMDMDSMFYDTDFDAEDPDDGYNENETSQTISTDPVNRITESILAAYDASTITNYTKLRTMIFEQVQRDLNRGMRENIVEILQKNYHHKTHVCNNTSIVGILRFNQFKALLTGDCDMGSWNEILRLYDPRDLQCTFWKIPHHGTAHNSYALMVYHAHPQIAFCPTGRYIVKDKSRVVSRGGTPQVSAVRYPILNGCSTSKIYNNRFQGHVRLVTDGYVYAIDTQIKMPDDTPCEQYHLDSINYYKPKTYSFQYF